MKEGNSEYRSTVTKSFLIRLLHLGPFRMILFDPPIKIKDVAKAVFSHERKISTVVKAQNGWLSGTTMEYRGSLFSSEGVSYTDITSIWKTIIYHDN